MHFISIFTLLLSLIFTLNKPNLPTSQIREITPVNKVYKTIDSISLTADIYYPEDYKEGEKKPAILFYFGGGWVGGNRDHFKPQSQYLASRGMIAITVDYRIKSKYGTSPVEAVMDAKSAMRWVVENADNLGIDKTKIVAAGGSAGGHLAATTAIIEGFNDEKDNLNISTVPSALVLFNPVIDTTEKGYGAKKLGDQKVALSPVHHVKKNLPPTVIFHGTADTTVPFENVERFQKLMKRKGNKCLLFPYKDEAHGFFNIRNGDDSNFKSTLKKTDVFLSELGYLEGNPTID